MDKLFTAIALAAINFAHAKSLNDAIGLGAEAWDGWTDPIL